MASRQPLFVEVTRGPAVESIHQVMAVVVNEVGSVQHYWGNPAFLTVPRSSIKMLQALALVESGAVEKFALEDRHIALACASHRGEKEHLTALAAWMEKVGIEESMLVCAGHLSTHEATAHEMIRKNHKPTAVCNNCSGKHAGIITTCLHLGENPSGYEKYEHPSQVRLRKVLSEVMKTDHSKAPFGVDGCGIPTYAVPLQAVAVGMSALLNRKESSARKAASEKILAAVKAYPHMLSGADEFTSVIIEKTQGRSIVKGGAEGVMTGLIPAKGLAFAVKTADGASRAAQVATASLLLNFGGLTEAEFKSLMDYTQPPIRNWRGDVVGQVRVAKAN